MTKEELLEIKAMMQEVVSEELKPIKEDISVLKQDISILKEDVSILKEEAAINRHSLNLLITWAEKANRVANVGLYTKE
jgi:hypothetical protein